MSYGFNDRAAAMNITGRTACFSTIREISVPCLLCRQGSLALRLREYIYSILGHQVKHSVDVFIRHRSVNHYNMGTFPIFPHLLQLGEVIFEAMFIMSYVAYYIWIIRQFLPAAAETGPCSRPHQGVRQRRTAARQRVESRHHCAEILPLILPLKIHSLKDIFVTSP